MTRILSIWIKDIFSSTFVKCSGLYPVQLSNYFGAGPPKKSLSNSYFQIKLFCHFQRKFAIRLRAQVANDTLQHDLRSKALFLGNSSQPWPGSRRKIYFKQQRFLELYPYLYPVQIPNYLGAVLGTGLKT